MVDKVKEIIKKFIDFVMIFKITFLESIARNTNSSKGKKTYLEALMLIAAHSLEKGMGLKHIKNGYGKQKALKLLFYLNKYCQNGYEKNTFSYIESIKVLQVYINYQIENGEDIIDIQNKFIEVLEKTGENEIDKMKIYNAGFSVVNREDVLKAKNFDFESFIKLRSSVRDYKREVVDKKIIERAVEISNNAPSACNRQPIKIYVTDSLEQANYLDIIISGTGSFKGEVPNFAVITCDRNYFIGSEQYQWYINGGIYVSYFLLALHSLGIGSVIMQWFQFYKSEKEVKKFFNITKSEAIIGIVGYGYLNKSFKKIKAQRKSVEETLIVKRD